MILDNELIFSDKQAITATAASTNVLDLGSVDAGNSDNLFVSVSVDEGFTNLTSLGIKLQSASNAAFTTPVDSSLSSTVLLADLTAGTEAVKAKLPFDLERYVRMYYTVTGTAPDAGEVTASIVTNLQTNK